MYAVNFGMVALKVNVNDYFLPFFSFLSEADNDNFGPEIEISVEAALVWLISGFFICDR